MKTSRDPDGSITGSFSLNGGSPFSYKAEDVRRERTGVHAHVTIFIESTLLAHDEFNVSRDAERVRLINSALSVMGEEGKALDKAVVKHEFDLFARELWPVYLGQFATEKMAGDAEPSRPDFLLEPYILRSAGTILYGPPERGKSWTGLIWAVSLDAGLSIFWPVTATPTVYVNLERPRASISRRLARVNMALGLEATRPLLVNNARGRALQDVIDELRSLVRDKGVGCIVLDSISRAGLGDLTENQPANKIIDTLNSLGCAWVGLAHSPRGDDTHVYGSVFFDAGADVMVQADTELKDDGTLGVGLQITKKNDIKPYPQQILAYEFEPELGLSRVRTAEPHEFLEIQGKEKRSMRQSVIDYLTDIGKAITHDIADALDLDRAAVSRLLNKDAAFVKLNPGKRPVYFGLKARPQTADFG